jgi:arabinose-5-phosphate isomerase
MSTPDFARHRERHIIMAREVIRNEARALEETAEAIGADFADAVELMAACTGQIVVCGVGKSGHVAAKVASTLSATGTPASFLKRPTRSTATSAACGRAT